MDNYRYQMYGSRSQKNCGYQEMDNSCGCSNEKATEQKDCRTENKLDNMALAMSYVPWQCFNEVFSIEDGICQGTIFPELVLPFYGDWGACQVRGGKCGCR